MNIWKEVLEESGMELNTNKTKAMGVAEDQQNLNIKIEGVRIEQLHQFENVIIEKHGKQQMEINKRVEKAIKVYLSIICFMNKKEVFRKIKLNVYRAVYKLLLAYASETWTLTNCRKVKSKLQR